MQCQEDLKRLREHAPHSSHALVTPLNLRYNQKVPESSCKSMYYKAIAPTDSSTPSYYDVDLRKTYFLKFYL